MGKRKGVSKSETVIRSVEIELTSGLHILIAPIAGRACCWLESDTGYRLNYEEASIEQLLAVLQRVRDEKKAEAVE